MKREKSITFRVNDLEDGRIKAMADRRQKTVAEYLRWLVDRDEAALAQESQAQPTTHPQEPHDPATT